MYHLAEIEIKYHPKIQVRDCPQITGSHHAYDLLLNHWNDDLMYRESFYAMYLNKANRVKGISLISVGGIDGTVADPKIILAIGLKTLSSSIILAHNHPSGNLQPSNADKTLTQNIAQAGELVGIKVLDHLILTPKTYSSFADHGEM